MAHNQIMECQRMNRKKGKNKNKIAGSSRHAQCSEHSINDVVLKVYTNETSRRRPNQKKKEKKRNGHEEKKKKSPFRPYTSKISTNKATSTAATTSETARTIQPAVTNGLPKILLPVCPTVLIGLLKEARWPQLLLSLLLLV